MTTTTDHGGDTDPATIAADHALAAARHLTDVPNLLPGQANERRRHLEQAWRHHRFAEVITVSADPGAAAHRFVFADLGMRLQNALRGRDAAALKGLLTQASLPSTTP
jgi:hypothetical protein